MLRPSNCIPSIVSNQIDFTNKCYCYRVIEIVNWDGSERVRKRERKWMKYIYRKSTRKTLHSMKLLFALYRIFLFIATIQFHFVLWDCFKWHSILYSQYFTANWKNHIIRIIWLDNFRMKVRPFIGLSKLNRMSQRNNLCDKLEKAKITKQLSTKPRVKLIHLNFLPIAKCVCCVCCAKEA